MRLRSLLAAAFVLLCAAPAIAAEPIPVSLQQPEISAAELVARYRLDRLFPQFGETLATSPRLHGVTDERFLSAWEQCALDTFAGPGLAERLGNILGDALGADDIAGLGQFLSSPFGQQVAGLELATQAIPPARQLGVIAKGQTLYWEVSDRRKAQFDELLSLTGAEMTFAMLGESLRGMAMGLRLAGADGEIEVPWSEIDAEVQRQLGGLKESLTSATLSVLAYTYSSLSDAEIEAYLEFLRAPATRKFYAVTTVAIGDILRETMFALGENVAQRLARVDI